MTGNLEAQPLTEHLSVSPGKPCRLTGLQAALHYETELIEEGRVLLIQNLEACLKRRLGVVERMRESKGQAADLSLLCKELKEISKRIEEIATEGEWLEMEAARKKYALFMAKQKHDVITL